MRRLVVFFVASAVAVALAAVYVPAPAASVGTASVSRQALDSDLSAIASSADYTCYLSEARRLAGGRAVPFLGAGTASAHGGIYDTAFVDDWLDQMVTDRVVAGLVARRALDVTPGDLALGRAVLARRITDVLEGYAQGAGSPVAACGGSGQAVLASLPAWFVGEQARAEADQAVLDARAAGAGLGTAGVRAYLARHARAFSRACLDVIVVRTRGAASRVERALASGTPFASEAAAASATARSAAAGGDAGCGVLSGSFLGRQVDRLRVGEVSTPFSGDGYWWVVRVASRSSLPLRAVRGAVLTAMLRAGQGRADREIARALATARLSVDPRYGASSGGLVRVRPPAPPPTAALVSGAALVAPPTAATS